KIEVMAGAPGRIVVSGAATVKVGWNVPADAADIARQVAAAPPVAQDRAVVRAGLPDDERARRGGTGGYRIWIPPKTEVHTESESGATTVHGVTSRVSVRTQSGSIGVDTLSGSTEIKTGSGSVDASDIAGALAVTTSSSAFSGVRLGASLTLRTRSG